MKLLLHKWAIIEPLPFVTRVVYIATPFRGSFQAKGWVRNIIQRIVSIPIGILALPYDVVAGNPNVVGDLFSQMKLPFEVGNKIPSSVDGMSPKSTAANPCDDARSTRSQGAFNHCHRWKRRTPEGG